MVRITDEEAESLADYLWMSFIPFIQDKDNEVDNLEYVRNIANVWKKCDAVSKERQNENLSEGTL